MKNLYCRMLLVKNLHQLPIDDLMSNKWSHCINKETLSGYQLNLFPSLLQKNKHCYRPDQMYFIPHRISPYTGKRVIVNPDDTSYPITEQYHDTLCPLETNMLSQGDYIFIVSPTPISSKKHIQKQTATVPISKHIDANLWKPVAVRQITPSNLFSLYYYIAKLEKPEQRRIHTDNIATLCPLYAKQDIPLIKETFYDQKLIHQLSEYFLYKRQRLSVASLRSLQKLSIRLTQPVSVYRGILIHGLTELKKAKLDRLTTGDTLIMESRGLPVSWSTDSCISQYFATHSPARHSIKKQQTHFGILLSCTLLPSQIALDTRLLDRTFFKERLYRQQQQEIITFPYDKDGNMMVFKCRIERLFLVDLKINKTTIMHSYAKFTPLLSK